MDDCIVDVFLLDKEVDNREAYMCGRACDFFFIFGWCDEIPFDVVGRDRSNFMRGLDGVEIIIVGRIDGPIVDGVITNLEVDVVIGVIVFFFFFLSQ